MHHSRIQELEAELQNVVDTKCKDSFAFIENAKNYQTNEAVVDGENEDMSYKLGIGQSEFTVNSGAGTDRGNGHGLKEDLDQINE